ncbi:SDR family NAD(P)-dependent oxidoreductase [Nevskia sp.]|uniref:SDR family NAD(P)-dependent oxidoreductase n=1 Tax=Nevskia sp. TaxID=1929292 RepID=UPI0025F8C6CE|nr:SDR family NAD(P)-dependent oxidoreductase [Nevskia sp.]
MKNWKHALISGGGSGLGHGLAVRLLRRGTSVSVLDLAVSDERRSALEAAAEQGHARWQFVEANIADETRVGAAVADAVLAFGAPDLAINSAGIGLSRAFSAMRTEDFRRVIEVNLMGSYHFAAAVIPQLRPGARLALVASLAGIVSNYSYSAYGTSKFGVVGLATTLRYEYEPRGIHISCICPPEVKTPLVTQERADGDPVAMDVKLIAGSMELDPACDQMLAGLDAGRWMIIPSFAGKATAFAAQRMPGLFYRFMDTTIRKYMRKHGVPVIS